MTEIGKEMMSLCVGFGNGVEAYAFYIRALKRER